jgi:hypothetical protein
MNYRTEARINLSSWFSAGALINLSTVVYGHNKAEFRACRLHGLNEDKMALRLTYISQQLGFPLSCHEMCLKIISARKMINVSRQISVPVVIITVLRHD